MISKIGKITLYVNNQEAAKRFWVNQVGFLVSLEQQAGPVHWLEVTPGSLAGTTMVLYDKAQMREDNPSLNLDAPSLIFEAADVEGCHKKLKANGVEVGELMKLPYGTMFQFQDQDGNEFLVRGA